MKAGIELIAEERLRQIEKEGWTFEHDDQHTDESLAGSAAWYACPEYDRVYRYENHFPITNLNGNKVPITWPWHDDWWKPTPNDRVKELQKAGALIAAEIDRLQRIKND